METKTESATEVPAPRFVVKVGNDGFRGLRAGVSFMDGTGTTDDPLAAEECRRLGYRVKDRLAHRK